MVKISNIVLDLRYLFQENERDDKEYVKGILYNLSGCISENPNMQLFFYVCDKKHNMFEKGDTVNRFQEIVYLDEKDRFDQMDIWISVGMRAPACVREKTLTTKYAIVHDLRRKIYEEKAYDAVSGKMEYGLEYLEEYDYVILFDEEEKEILLQFQKELRWQQIILMNQSALRESLARLLNSVYEREKQKQRVPLVTVVTITYNLIKAGRTEYIQQCIESVHRQTYHHIEHIVIDGASDDGTIEILKKYENEGYLTYYSEPDDGLYDAMNKGIDRAKGKYIAFLNSDDFYHDICGIENAVKIMERDELDYCYSNAVILNEDKSTFLWEANINNMPFATHYCHQTMLVKVNVMKELGGFDLKYKISSDSDLMIRLYACRYLCKKVNACYLTYRGGGISATQAEQAQKDHSDTFFRNIGYKIGLSAGDCKELWQYKFFDDMFLDQQIHLLARLGTVFHVDGLFIQAVNRIRLTTRMKNKMIEKKILVNHRKVTKSRIINFYFLCDKIPCFITVYKMK